MPPEAVGYSVANMHMSETNAGVVPITGIRWYNWRSGLLLDEEVFGDVIVKQLKRKVR